jgi:hypothetical protein
LGRFSDGVSQTEQFIVTPEGIAREKMAVRELEALKMPDARVVEFDNAAKSQLTRGHVQDRE